MEKIKISKLTGKDAVSVHRLLYSIIEELHGEDRKATEIYKGQYPIKRIRKMVGKDYCFVAKAGDKLVGFGLGHIFGGVGFLHWLGVANDYRSSGIGSMLMKEIDSYFKKNRCHAAGVYTGMYNKKLLNFYKRKGYHIKAKLTNHWFHLNVAYLVKQF